MQQREAACRAARELLPETATLRGTAALAMPCGTTRLRCCAIPMGGDG
ncbi:MAG: hypothetical protein ACLTY5_04745 [Angelakisella sp.]